MDSAAWDARYEATDLVWSSEPNQFLPALVADLPAGRALDVACGEGRNAIWLAKQGWEVTGIDFSAVAIDKAQRLADRAGVDATFLVADLTTWQSQDSFDLIIEFYLHVPADLRRAVHRSLSSALGPEGTYVLVGHHTANLERGVGGPQDGAVLFSETDVVADFEGVLRPVTARAVTRAINDGVAIDVVFVGRAPLPQTD